MKRGFLTLLTLVFLTSLACGQYVTPTPEAAATVSYPPPPPVQPSPTASPRPTATESDAGTATVRAAVVNMRSTAGGNEVVIQLVAGSDVTLTGDCSDGWCPVTAINGDGEAVDGWIWEGCLSVETERKCEAK